jgi:hypothetical protein
MKTDAEVQIMLGERHSGCLVEHSNATRCSDARSGNKMKAWRPTWGG